MIVLNCCISAFTFMSSTHLASCVHLIMDECLTWDGEVEKAFLIGRYDSSCGLYMQRSGHSVDSLHVSMRHWILNRGDGLCRSSRQWEACMKQSIHLKKMKGHIFGVIFINMFPAVFVSSGTNHIAVMINMKCRVWNSIHHPGLLGVNIPGLSMVVLDDLYWNQVLCVHGANLVLKPVICGGKTQPLCSIAFKEGCDIWRLQCLILLPMYYIFYLESSSENGASQFLWQACILY